MGKKSSVLWGILKGIIMLCLILFLFVFIVFLINQNSFINDKSNVVSAIENDDYRRITDKLSGVENKLLSIERALDKNPDKKGVVALSARVSKIESDVNMIKRAIGNSPEKSLNIVLLRRDIELLRKEHEMSTEMLSREIVNTFDIIKWSVSAIVIVLVTMGLGVILKSFWNVNN